jgi:prepilin-type processing-associated H-X9-DG protein
MARETARGMSCKNNQKQLALAVIQFEGTHKRFPAGSTTSCCAAIACPDGTNCADVKAGRECTHVIPAYWDITSSTGANNDHGVGGGALGWGARLMPFLENTPLYDQVAGCFANTIGHRVLVADISTRIFQTQSGDGLIPYSLSQMNVPLWRCPSCTGEELLTLSKFARGNYVGLAGPHRTGQCGDGKDIAASNGDTSHSYFNYGNADGGDYSGLFFQGHPPFTGADGYRSEGNQPALDSITDGASNCLLISERSAEHLSGNPQDIEPNRLATSWIGGAAGVIRDVTFFTSYPPNDKRYAGDSGSGERVHAACAASMHPGGVNAALADGSVQFVESAIDPTLWRNLGDRQDGQVASF